MTPPRAGLGAMWGGREVGECGVTAAVLKSHWLVFNNDRAITGCHCGFRADEADCGYGDSVLEHLAEVVHHDAWLAGFRTHRDGDMECPHRYGKGDHHWESGDCLAAEALKDGRE